ncbi:hypothetical protein NARC_10111 [Candidatus Nitrosocosmicus arcticus]|uniref:Uncharacterized protein n=1 Tax=Candidatus Nitrosocosmicus arcticus TaxID=2035267 RepID=A0A557SYM1_9ARCH|nr:hypothetical protein NARC_10111 [Candidatus Nitrosocosmicus arcticus]
MLWIIPDIERKIMTIIEINSISKSVALTNLTKYIFIQLSIIICCESKSFNFIHNDICYNFIGNRSFSSSTNILCATRRKQF